jgi:hypothetical protein
MEIWTKLLNFLLWSIHFLLFLFSLALLCQNTPEKIDEQVFSLIVSFFLLLSNPNNNIVVQFFLSMAFSLPYPLSLSLSSTFVFFFYVRS